MPLVCPPVGSRQAPDRADVSPLAGRWSHFLQYVATKKMLTVVMVPSIVHEMNILRGKIDGCLQRSLGLLAISYQLSLLNLQNRLIF